METLKKVTEQINFGDTLKDRSFLVTGATDDRFRIYGHAAVSES